METLEMIQKGMSVIFTFKDEAERFAAQAKLEIEYDDGGMIDDEHYNIKGYEAKLYWMCA